MDSIIIAAIAGVLGGILELVIGGVLALKATEPQLELMLLQSHGDVNERLYDPCDWLNSPRKFNRGGKHRHNSTAVLRGHIATRTAWYADDFLRLRRTQPNSHTGHLQQAGSVRLFDLGCPSTV